MFYLASTITVILIVALQQAWPPWLQMANTTPHLGLIAVVGFGLLRGPQTGVIMGFVAAFFSAASGSAPMGDLFISHMLAGFGAGLFRGGFFSTRISVATLVVFAASIVASLLHLLIVPPSQPQPWLYPMFMRAIFTAICCVPLYAFIRWLNSRLPGHDDQY
ncbi:MAG: hypothetical protein R6V19_17225 [Armatimonadota bacterium]